MALGTNGRRVAVIQGCRTPFCRSGTDFNNVSAVDLARHAAREVLQRSELDPGGGKEGLIAEYGPRVS